MQYAVSWVRENRRSLPPRAFYAALKETAHELGLDYLI
jgi:hypothetical protein